MGVENEDELTDAQRRYKTKLIDKIETVRDGSHSTMSHSIHSVFFQRAAELKRQSGVPCVEFETAKVAYGRGAYPACCELLEKAALEHAESSILGGEIRLWLALTYQVSLYRPGNARFPNRGSRHSGKQKSASSCSVDSKRSIQTRRRDGRRKICSISSKRPSSVLAMTSASSYRF